MQDSPSSKHNINWFNRIMLAIEAYQYEDLFADGDMLLPFIWKMKKTIAFLEGKVIEAEIKEKGRRIRQWKK